MENKLIIGNKEFEIKINFRKSYQLTKYRNKLAYGFDFADADKKIIEEITQVQLDVSQGKEVDIEKLSTETQKYLIKKSSEKDEVFNYEELIEIGKILTEIEDDKELEELYDTEVQENGYDELTSKLTYAISMVFTNAKDTSNQANNKKTK